MATYKEIHGTNIEVVSSDPSNPVNGQVWYNSTDQKLKGNAQTTVQQDMILELQVQLQQL